MQKRLADNEEMNFLYENKKQKISCSELRSQAMIHHLAILNNSVNNWSMQGSSFKQIKLSQSLENTENCT